MTGEGADRLVEVAIGVEKVTIGRAPLRALATLLAPGEEPRAVGIATRAARWWQELRGTNLVVLLATDRRLLVVPYRPLADSKRETQVEAIDYAEVSGVELRRGRLESKLDVTTRAGELRFTSLRGVSAAALADTIRTHL